MTDQPTQGRKVLRTGANVRLATGAPALLVLLIGIGVGDLLIFAASTNLALNGSIIGLTVLAAGMAFMRAADIDLDRSEIHRIARDSAETDQQQLSFKLHGPLAHAFAMIQRSAANDGHRAFQTAVDRETDLLRSSLNQRLAVLQYMTGLLISLGLLGTFLGLLRTLVASSEVLDAVGIGAGSLESGDATEMFSTMILSLKAPLTNMGTAFSSSLFGLVGSITVGVMVLILQRTANTNISRFRNLMLSSRDWLFSFKQEESVDASTVQDILTAMLERERLAARRADDVLAGFATSLSALAESSVRMEGLGNHLGKMTEQLTVLPTWCARNDGVVGALQEVKRGMEGIAKQIDLMGREMAASTLRAEAQRDAVRLGLEGLHADLHEQSVQTSVVEAHLLALSAGTDTISGQLTGMLSNSANVHNLGEAIVQHLAELAKHVAVLGRQSETGLEALDGIAAELGSQSVLNREMLDYVASSTDKLEIVSAHLQSLLSASSQNTLALRLLEKVLLEISGCAMRLQAQNAVLEPLSDVVGDMSRRLRDLVEQQAVEGEAAHAFRSSIATGLVQTERQLVALNAMTSRQVSITDQALSKGFAALTLLTEEFQRLFASSVEQVTTGHEAAKLLLAVQDHLLGISDHLSQISDALPAHQRSFARLENLLNALSSLEAQGSEQVNLLDRMVDRLGRIEDVHQASATILGELSSGQSSQVQLLSSVLGEHRLQAERDASLGETAERTHDAMLRLEGAVANLPQAALIMDQSRALASRVVPLVDQFATMLRAQSDVIALAVEEYRIKEVARSDALKQIFGAIVKLTDVMEIATGTGESQHVSLRDLEKSLKTMEKSLHELAESSAERDGELVRAKTMIGRIEDLLQKMAQKMDKWLNPHEGND